eukprot:g439.t1
MLQAALRAGKGNEMLARLPPPVDMGGCAHSAGGAIADPEPPQQLPAVVRTPAGQRPHLPRGAQARWEWAVSQCVGQNSQRRERHVYVQDSGIADVVVGGGSDSGVATTCSSGSASASEDESSSSCDEGMAKPCSGHIGAQSAVWRAAVFRDLTAKQRRRVAAALRPASFVDGEFIIRQGDVGDTFYLIQSGELRVVVDSGADAGTSLAPSAVANSAELARLGPGEYVGEMALLAGVDGDRAGGGGKPAPEESRRSASVVAVGAVKCLALARAEFAALLQRHTRLREGLVARSAQRRSALRRAVEAEVRQLRASSRGSSPQGGRRRLATVALKLTDLEQLTILGRGSFGVVRLARRRQGAARPSEAARGGVGACAGAGAGAPTVFALKVLQKHKVCVARQQRNVLREKEVLLLLQHPFVPRLFCSFQDAHCLYMLLELVQGGELFRLLHGDGAEERRLPLARARFFAACVALVFDSVHALDVLYRDLKPENLLVDAQGYLKLVDWGFAKVVAGAGVGSARTHTVCGTPEYLAPEMLRGSGYGCGADLWALGVLVYEMVSGRSAFVGDHWGDTMSICESILAHRSAAAPRLPGGGPGGKSGDSAGSGADGGAGGGGAGRLVFPEHCFARSAAARCTRAFVEALLEPDPALRLGCRGGAGAGTGAGGLRGHAWFAIDIATAEGEDESKGKHSVANGPAAATLPAVDWKAMLEKRVPAPCLPPIRDHLDVSNFARYDEDEPVVPYEDEDKSWCEGF